MRRLPRIVSTPLLCGGLLLLASSLLLRSQTSVRAVKVLESKDAVEIEVEASDQLVPQTRVLAGPDRLVVDFPNATPGAQLRSQSVNRGEVKDLRIGLFQSKPPVTRIVLDLKTAQSYQIFPSGRTTIIKVTGNPPESAGDAAADANDALPAQARPGLVAANYVTGAKLVPAEAEVKPLDVTFRNGLLTIKANRATLAQVLTAVQQRTGAEIGMVGGAEQETVVVNLGPAPASEVMADLLHGSKFNFLILSSATDPSQLDRVILSQRAGGGAMPFAQAQQPPQTVTPEDDPPQEQVQTVNPQPPPAPIRPLPGVKDGDDTPDQ